MLYSTWYLIFKIRCLLICFVGFLLWPQNAHFLLKNKEKSPFYHTNALSFTLQFEINMLILLSCRIRFCVPRNSFVFVFQSTEVSATTCMQFNLTKTAFSLFYLMPFLEILLSCSLSLCLSVHLYYSRLFVLSFTCIYYL